jgi:5'(3')-deoxyribonucleotidase
MNKPKISFDCDGVLAGGHYIPAWDRQPQVYARLPLLDYAVPNVLNKLMNSYNVYIVTGRKFDGALETTQEWLAENNVDVHHLAGVVTGVPRLLKPVIRWFANG